MKLVTPGCSLSPIQTWPRWSYELLWEELFYKGYDKDKLLPGSNHIHIAKGGRGNTVNAHQLNRHIINQGLDNTYVIWQLSGWQRLEVLADEKYVQLVKTMFPDKQKFTLESPAMFTDTKIVSGWGGQVHENLVTSFNATLENVVALICLCAMQCQVIVFRGWTGAVPDDIWTKITDRFDQFGVIYTDFGYVDWVKSNGDDMQQDELHPNEKGAEKFFDNILKPYIRQWNIHAN